MTAAPRGRRGGDPFVVGARSLPPWDRTGGGQIDLTPLAGQHAAVSGHAAARLLGTKSESLVAFCKAGVIREGRIVEREFDAGGTTYLSVIAEYWSHIYLEPGEEVLALTFGRPNRWSVEKGSPDVERRTCLRIRHVGGPRSDHLTILTGRRTYRIALVDHPFKVTIGCSWTYADAPRPRTPAGEITRPSAARSNTARTTRFAIFELGRSIKDLVVRWGLDLQPTKTWQLHLHRDMRRLASIPSIDPLPPAVVEAVLKRLLEVGTMHVDEARQWLELSQGSHFDDTVMAIADRSRRNRLPLPGNIAPTQEDLATAFPCLTGLARTCYDQDDPGPAPASRALKIVWQMKDLALVGAIFCVIGPNYFLHAERVTDTLQRLATLENITRAAGIEVRVDDETSLDRAIEHVLASESLDRATDLVRHQVAYSLLLVVRLIRRYLRAQKAESLCGIAPAHPSKRVLAALGRYGRKIVENGRESRKRRVLRYAGKLADLELAAGLNLEQVIMTTRALRAAEKLLGDEDWVDVEVPTTIVDQRGRLVPGKQQLTWRVWRHSSFLRQLKTKSDVPHEVASLDQKLRECVESPHPPIHEYRSAKGILGSEPIEPFFVKCWRYGLIARPARLPRRVAHKRRTILRELKLPGAMTHGREALLTGTEYQMNLWRTALRQHRTIAFLDAFEHAMRFAHFGLSSTTENLSRTVAWLQQVQDQRGWTTRRLNGTDVIGFLAYDKVSHRDGDPGDPTWFPVANSHFLEGMELVRMTCEREGYDDGILPEISHSRLLLPKQPQPRAWMFSYQGSVLSHEVLNGFLRYLLPGFARLTYHDFRHLGANAAQDAGMPGWKIRLALNHASQNLWEYYAMQNRRQEAAFADGHVRHRTGRIADLRAQQDTLA